MNELANPALKRDCPKAGSPFTLAANCNYPHTTERIEIDPI